MWRKYFTSWEIFFGILCVTAKFFVKSENIFPPRRKKVGKILRVTATLRPVVGSDNHVTSNLLVDS
jgi:hypothetical protein